MTAAQLPTRFVVPAAAAIYLVIVGVLLAMSLRTTGGDFTYAQDDPYIHLAMARTLAEHGVWGIRPTEFASASSSPLWTLLLAALWTLGVKAVWVPFAVNVLCGLALIVVCSRILALLLENQPARLAALAAMIVVTPLPTLAFVGMEHTLQVLLVVSFAWQVATRLAGHRSDWLWPCVLAATMVATRYECLFLVAVTCAALAWMRRPGPAIAIGAAAALPVIAFALYSVAHGGLILPNSVLMKSLPGRFGSLSSGFASVAADWMSVRDLFLRPPQLALTLATLVGLLFIPSASLTPSSRPAWLAVLFVGSSVLHACLVKLEWFYRYEAYLIALGVLTTIAISTLAVWPRAVPRKRARPLHPAAVPMLVLLAIPLAVRALTALAVTAPATRNVHEQQVQLGRFFQIHYAERPIAVNDLGAVTWLSTSPILDIVGLASQPVAELKRRQQLDADALDGLVRRHGVEVIALYENIFESIEPTSWRRVGTWTIHDNVGVSGATVTFLAPDEPKAVRLEEALRAFTPLLPAGVKVAVRESPAGLPPAVSQ